MPGQGSTDEPPLSQSRRRKSTAAGLGVTLTFPRWRRWHTCAPRRLARSRWRCWRVGCSPPSRSPVGTDRGQSGRSIRVTEPPSPHPQTPKSAPAQPWWCCQRCNIGCCTVGSWRGCWSPGCPAPAKPRFELPTHQEPWPGSRARSQPGCLPVMVFGLWYESVAAPSGASSASGQGAPWGAPIAQPCALPRDGRAPGVHLCRIQLEAAPAAARHKLGARECAGLSTWLRIQGIISQFLGSTPAAPAAPAPPPAAPTAPTAPALACSASTDLQFPATVMQ